MLTATELAAVDLNRLNQGDVLADVAVLFSPDVVQQVEQREFGGTKFFKLQDTQPGSQIALVETLVCPAIILSYDCEIDRVLRRFAKRKAQEPSDVVTIAAIYDVTEFEEATQKNIRKENSGRYLLIDPSTLGPERVVDFSSLQTIPTLRLLQHSGKRVHGLTNEGKAKMIRGLAYHLGEDGRAGGPDEPDLLNDALSVLAEMQS